MKTFVLFLVFGILVALGGYLFWEKSPQESERSAPFFTLGASPSPLPDTPKPIPSTYIIPQKTHVFQTFNNCGPASLSMALSYWGQAVSQQELGQQLRPYQNSLGNNDDKSVTLDELAREAAQRGFSTYLRPHGTSQTLKQLIAADTPVIIRTWLKEGEDIGHFRVIRGYDDTTQEFIQDDSLQGANLRYTYEHLDQIWQPFNSEYLVLVLPEKQVEIEQILGENLNTDFAWRETYDLLQARVQKNPDDLYSQFNLSVAAYNLGEYQIATEAFERVESRLPSRMLWYQIEPIQAYFKQGKYQRVLELSDGILNNGNRAFSELYELRSHSYEQLGQPEKAAEERAKILLYHRNYQFMFE